MFLPFSILLPTIRSLISAKQSCEEPSLEGRVAQPYEGLYV